MLRNLALPLFAAVLIVAALGSCSTSEQERSKTDAHPSLSETSKASAELPLPSRGTENTNLTVLAASSTTEAMRTVCDLFEKAHGVSVRLSTGSSNALAQQILSGAPADLFLSANPEWIELLEEKGQVGRSKPLLSNRLVLVVPRDNPAGIESPEDLRRPEVRRVSLAGPNVPAGRYAEQALRSTGQWRELDTKGKVVRASNVRIALTYVERSETEAGIVYETDVRNARDVLSVFRFAREDHEPIVYPVAMLSDAGTSAGADAFFEFLDSHEARTVFESFGFSTATR